MCSTKRISVVECSSGVGGGWSWHVKIIASHAGFFKVSATALFTFFKVFATVFTNTVAFMFTFYMQ